jgi:hypothetical protein
MRTGLEKLHSGDFNDMMQERQPDGSVIITLSSRNYPEVYKFRVRNLYQPNEEELDATTGEPINEGNIQAALPKVPSKGKKASSKQGN